MDEQAAAAIITRDLHRSPLQLQRMTLTHSGNAVWSAVLPDDEVVLRASQRPAVFAHTARNIELLERLGLPVPQVLSAGEIDGGGCYIILRKLPGRDLLYELPTMTTYQVSRLAERIVTFQRQAMTLPAGLSYGWGQPGIGGSQPTWFYLLPPTGAVSSQACNKTAAGAFQTRVHQHLVEMQPYMQAVHPTCFLDDLTTKNVLLQGGELQGIIDLDFFCFGDPLWQVGVTAGCIVNDLGPEFLCYTDELCRCWNVTPLEQRVIQLYAAIRALEFLEDAAAAHDHARARRLSAAVEQWLAALERDSL